MQMSTASASIGTVAPTPGFDRWLIPPAALAVHLSIGQLYAFSVFNEPLTRAHRDQRAGAGGLAADRSSDGSSASRSSPSA